MIDIAKKMAEHGKTVTGTDMQTLRAECESLKARAAAIDTLMYKARNVNAFKPSYKLVSCEVSESAVNSRKKVCSSCGCSEFPDAWRFKVVLTSTPEQLKEHAEIWGERTIKIDPEMWSLSYRWVADEGCICVGRIYGFGGGFHLFEREGWTTEVACSLAEWENLQALKISDSLREKICKSWNIEI